LFGAGAAESSVSGLAPLPELERAYAALTIEIAKAADSAHRDRIERVSGAFVWAQAMSVAALWFLAAILFALAWFMHDRLIAPLERLRSSVNGAAAGAMGETVWGIDRNDEVGGIARAAERLRQAALAAENIRSAQNQERLAGSAASLEGDFARVASIAIEAQARIEAASARAAQASEAALEAAGLAREGSARFADRAEAALEFASVQTNAVLGALATAVSRLSDAASRVEQTSAERASDPLSGSAPRLGTLLTRLTQEGNRFVSPKSLESDEGEAVVEDLVSDLEALERFARERKDIAGDQAVAMTATLIETIDRLNAVADRISASADDTPLRAAS
jgi:methyl-accepting chemotaxis protein